MKKTLAIDMDGVIADMNSEWIRRYNDKYACNETVELFSCWDVHTLVPCGLDIYSFLDEGDFFASLPVIENSQEVLKKLQQYYELMIVTAPYNQDNIKPKYQWLQKYFSFIPEENYMFVRNKSLARADFLLDDKPSNLEAFYGGKLLFTAPHNYTENRFTRLNNWAEVEEYFMTIK